MMLSEELSKIALRKSSSMKVMEMAYTVIINISMENKCRSIQISTGHIASLGLIVALVR